MNASLLKRMVSMVMLVVFLAAQLTPVYGRSSGIPFSSAGQYASTGKLNCFPDAGSWIEGYSQFYWDHKKDGSEIKPSVLNSDFSYGWVMLLEGCNGQIKSGLVYNISFEVFGHYIDGDVARVHVDFWVPLHEGSGYITYDSFQEDPDGWRKANLSGYVPEGAKAMRLRLSGVKAKDFIADSDCAIYYRNIEIYITDDIAPAPKSIEYGERRELGTTEERRMKDYYGAGDDVYWDLEFNEPIFVNDPEYLSYARGLGIYERGITLNNLLTAKYPNDKLALSHVQYNSGKGILQQFGELKLKFKYKNSDGRDMTGYAYPVDKSRYNKETYGNDYSNQIKFKYTVRPGDEFQASDIYEMVLEGGVITDNAFNPMPNECRTISFAPGSEKSINTVYRIYTQDFKVETAAPVLLEINGGQPDGMIGISTDLELYLKFSEPVYMTMSDEAFEKNNISKVEFNNRSYSNSLHAGQYSLDMNSRYVDWEGKEPGTYGTPKAYYWSGNGTTMLKFSYRVHENKFDPLEIIGSEINRSGVSCGEIYVMDAAGNVAPMLQDNNIKLSDKKWYMVDREPPEISVQTMKAEAGKGGFYVRVDVTDKGSGVDYDSLRFGFGYIDDNTRYYTNEIRKNMKPLIPGRNYHSTELGPMFGVDVAKSDTFKIIVECRDKQGNGHFSPEFGSGWSTVVNIDTAAPVLETCIVNRDKYSSELGSFYARITDGTGKGADSGLGSSPDIKYKWVNAGFNPDMEDWLPSTKSYHAGSGYYYGHGDRPAGYMYGDADLYLKAVDLAGNEAVFCMPKALEHDDMRYIEDRFKFDFQTWSEGKAYACKVNRFERGSSGVYKAFKGLWVCLTAEGSIPEFSATSGLWKYKEGDTVTTMDYEADPRARNGYYFMHVIAVDNDGVPIGAATSPTMLLFNFKEPVITADAEKRADGSWVVKPYAKDDIIRREDLKLQYSFNYTYAWKPLPDNGEIVVGRDLQNPDAWVQIRAENPSGGYYNAKIFGPYLSKVVQMTAPYINYYNGNRYTNEDFVQLLIGTEAQEFAYSLDGASWSSWLPLAKDKTISGYEFSAPCVPLPDKEGEISFYTRYRMLTGVESPAVKSTVVRDVTPPTGDVEIKSYRNSDYFYTAAPSKLTDNLCSSGEIEVVGDKTTIVSRGEPYYFIIKDGAGNKGELMAYVPPLPVVLPPVPDKDHGGGHTDEPEAPDTEAPVISVSPNGNSNNAKRVSPSIKVRDNKNIAKIEYAFTTDSKPGTVTSWMEIAMKDYNYNGNTVILSGVDGIYYLHVRATDTSGNASSFTSKAYRMVVEYVEPYILYSGEHEEVMRAFLVSEEPITVSEAVYDLRMGEEHTFQYTYDSDGTEGNITTDWEFDYDPDMNDYIGTVMISPYHKVTSGPVKVMLEAPTRFEGEPRYKDYFNELEFRPEDDGDGVLNSGLVSGAAGSIKILEGVIGTWDGSELSIDRVITGSDNFYYDEAAASLAEEGKLWVFKVEINTEANGLMIYHVNDGVYAIQIGHIVEDAELADNVKTAMTEMGRTAYAPWTLFASANRYAIAAGMRAAYKSLSGADLTPPVGKVSYTSADSKKGPVTASLRVADDSAGKITITNSGGSSHSFSANGQFVFEFVDEAGNKGRALAEVGTMATASSGIAVSYSTKHPTKDKVKVTMTPEAGITLKSGERATVLENGSYSFEASDNGSWKFIFVNEEGAESEITAAVVNIDRTPPTLKVEYIKDYYNKTVTAMVKSEEPIWAARGSTLIDTFKANGQQTLKAVDEAGNEASIEVPVNNIETLGIYKSNIDVKVNFSTTAMTNKPVRLTLTSDRAFTVLNNKGGKELEVIGSGKYQFIVKDSAGLVKIVEAQVNNIDTEAPVIKLGYPESTSIIAGEAIDVMNFTAVDNIDGDVKGKTKLEGTVNTKQPGTYQVSYTVVDSCGNKEVKLLTIKVLSPGEQIVTVNGIKYEDEPLLLAASKLQVTARGFSEPVKVKWTKGYESAAFFKASGTVAENGTAAISERGWFTLYVYDSDRNFRLIHIYIDNLGGGQQ